VRREVPYNRRQFLIARVAKVFTDKVYWAHHASFDQQEVTSLPCLSGRTLIHDHFVTSTFPGTLLDILSLAKNLSNSGPFMAQILPPRVIESYVPPVSWCSELVLKKREEVLAVCHVPLWCDIVHTSLVWECNGEIIHAEYVERTISSRNAGSKVPANERYSLRRYEIAIYLSGLSRMAAAAWGMPRRQSKLERENEMCRMPYLGEVQNKRLWIGNLRPSVRRHHPAQIMFTYLDICLENERWHDCGSQMTTVRSVTGV